eukprot:CAMPEP_0198695630 /NCGR_PEP_ID=MMETSP1468-20131203/291140_1 /TAXON_ID=1461545 /ORGANISM="Mantoniella sp, Strain CCMP1436" /LENGTH=106 /DNA_ID=CAMNT_0044451447 /DNA_START=79 /DNA_END=399 /DNA_ORIENTATION=+
MTQSTQLCCPRHRLATGATARGARLFAGGKETFYTFYAFYAFGLRLRFVPRPNHVWLELREGAVSDFRGDWPTDDHGSTDTQTQGSATLFKPTAAEPTPVELASVI